MDSSKVTCRVCLSQYDAEDHRPLLLPACGHTFCSFCVENLHHQGKHFCPKCRKVGAVQAVSSLPVNYGLLDILQNDSCKPAAATDSGPNEAGTNIFDFPTTASHHSLPNHNRPGRNTFDFPTTASHHSLPNHNRPVTNISGFPTTTSHHSLLNSNTTGIFFPAFSPTTSLHKTSNSHGTATGGLVPPATSVRPKFHGVCHRTRNHVTNPILGALPIQHNIGGASVDPIFKEDTAVQTPIRGIPEVHASSLYLEDELDFQIAVHLTFCKDECHDQNLHTLCSSWCWQKLGDEELTNLHT